MVIDFNTVLSFIILVTVGTLCGCLCILFCFYLADKIFK